MEARASSKSEPQGPLQGRRSTRSRIHRMDIARTIGQLTGNRFQDLVSRLLAAAISDFQAVNGDGGDKGNDGYSPNMAAVFQAYGPEKTEARRIRGKIDDSVKKTVRLRETSLPVLRRLIFVTPFDLTHDLHLHLQRSATTVGLISESWGNSRLIGLVAQHPEVARTFPEIQLLDLSKAVHPDPALLKKHVDARLEKISIEFIIQGALANIKSLEEVTRAWLNPTQGERVRRNFPVRIHDPRVGLMRDVGWIARIGAVAASTAVKALLAHLKVMVTKDEEHDRQMPQNEREEIAAQLFELTAQAKQRLNERLRAAD